MWQRMFMLYLLRYVTTADNRQLTLITASLKKPENNDRVCESGAAVTAGRQRPRSGSQQTDRHTDIQTDRQTDRQTDQTRPDQTRPDQTRPDQTRPDQTRPDQTRPDQTGVDIRSTWRH